MSTTSRTSPGAALLLPLIIIAVNVLLAASLPTVNRSTVEEGNDTVGSRDLWPELLLDTEFGEEPSERADAAGTSADRLQPAALEEAQPVIDDTTTPPDASASPQAAQAPKSNLDRLVCNYDVSAEDRPNTTRFNIARMDVEDCTDVYYDFTALDSFPIDHELMSELTIHWYSGGDEPTPRYAALNDHKMASPDLVTFLTVAEVVRSPAELQRRRSEAGSSGTRPGLTFRDLVSDTRLLMRFSKKALYQLRLWGFDGLAIRWPMDAGTGRLETLLGTLRATFDEEIATLKGYRQRQKRLTTLQIAVILDAGNPDWLCQYDMHTISTLVDQITVTTPLPDLDTAMVTQIAQPLYEVEADDDGGNNQTFTLPSTWNGGSKRTLATPQPSHQNVSAEVSSRVKRQAAQGNAPPAAGGDARSLHNTVEIAIKSGVTRRKLNVAVSLIGRGYQLLDALDNGVGADVAGPAKRADGLTAGQIFLYEGCQLRNSPGGTLARASNADHSPYWYRDDHWASFEDLKSISQKIDYLKGRSIGGIALFSQSEDDFTGGACGRGPYPITAHARQKSGIRSKTNALLPWQQFCNGGMARRGSDSSFTLMLLVVAFVLPFS